MLPYPAIDPVAIHLGPIGIRWYSLAYIAGIVLGWFTVRSLHRRRAVPNLSEKALDDLMLWAVLGVVLGGRLGYVLFYKPGYYLANLHEIPMLWQGGMSFHGGLIGVITAFFLFCRKYRIPYFQLMDVAAVATPIGLFFGRLANFINGELYGRVTDAWVGMVFPNGGELPRHPSQLYHASLEGLALFIVLFTLAHRTRIREKPGTLSGLFLIGYGISRIIVEFFREPDAQLGFLFAHVTMGQLLCVPMLLLGAYLVLRARRVAQA